MKNQLNVVMISSECRNFAKVGGLGDVLLDLSTALIKKNIGVSVILPYYSIIKCKMEEIFSCKIEFGTKSWEIILYKHMEHGVNFYFIKNDFFFSKEYGEIYIDSFKHNRGPFEDDAKRFAFFSNATIEILTKSDFFPDVDIIHCHDWHTGIFLLLLN